MMKLDEQILSSPAKEEYEFTFGGGIFGDYAPGQNNHVYTLLVTEMDGDEIIKGLGMPKNHLNNIMFKVRTGETLEEAVKRVIKEDFGLEIFAWEHRISTKYPDLAYARAVCRFQPPTIKDFRGFNYYWYGI